MDRKGNYGQELIILAGCFWGCMGIFVRKLGLYGFNPIQIACIRLTVAAFVFALVLFFREKSGFRIALRDLPLFLGLGFGSVLMFTVCYFSAITMMPLSTAAILLYTSPIWIMLMSVLFFKEKLNRAKILALALAFAGCVLVSGISGDGVTLPGVLLGLGAGIGYGLYSILGTIALRRYSHYTVTTYSFMFGAVGTWLVCNPADMIFKIQSADNLTGLLILCLAMGLVSAVIPFLAYTRGLRTVEASRAGILATIEPMVASLVGVFVFSEPLDILSGLGIVLILMSVILLSLKGSKSGVVIREVENKRDYLPLLLLADEQENLIDLYLDRGTMFVLEEDGIIKGECVVTDEGDGVLEIQNLAVAEEYQGKGYGKQLIEFVANCYRDRYKVLQVGTGDSPLTVPFYEHCGFVQDHIIKNYIINHYDHPIYEGGKQLIDKVYLRMMLDCEIASTNKTQHIFLTGEKQVGKSTIVSGVLSSVKLKYSGLRSISVFDKNNNRNVFIVPANKESKELAVLVGVCSNRHVTEKHPEVFDEVGCRLLAFDKNTQLVVIDEIGNMERDAELYSDRILELLERTDIRILGVLQKMADSNLAETIRKHPNVRMIEVTEENRNKMVPFILGLLEEK